MRHLVRRGHQVTAFGFRDYGRPWTIDGVDVHTSTRGGSHVHRLAAEADVVVSHIGDGGRGGQVAERAGIPLVQMAHGFMSAPHRAASLVVFVSDWMQREHAHRMTVPTIVCHPPTDPADYRINDDPYDRADVTIINCSPPKGIRTAWRVAERLPDRTFLGVKGGYGSQIEPRARNFQVIPSTQNMRDDVYARTRILLMPSEYESWGMVGVEAMAAGIPVIAHPAPGLVESLGRRAGTFVHRDDTDGWVDAIRALDDRDAYAAASERALARVNALRLTAGGGRFARAVEAVVAGETVAG